MKSRKNNKKMPAASRFLILLFLVFAILAGAGIYMLSKEDASTETSPAPQAGQTAQQEQTADSGEPGQPQHHQAAPADPFHEASGPGTSGNEFSHDAGTPFSVTLHPASGPDQPYTADLSDLPAYSGSARTEVNGNRPFFTEDEISSLLKKQSGMSFEEYGELDSLGRCTGACACIGKDLMPTGKRESISQVRPTGWHFTKYAGIDGNYLYNRCHLIAYGLTAENANERNLITGTRYMNTAGMNSLENETISYIRESGNHVLYRVTPIFEGDNLVASGVLMEGLSLEDDAVQFCVYAYNVQPGIVIDYATGESSGGKEFTGSESIIPVNAEPSAPSGGSSAPEKAFIPPAEDVTFVINTRSGKFHLPSCSSVKDMSQKNREDYTGSRDALIRQGYAPCGYCNP